jgi:lecithin-cholesterol acyltransferase
VRNVSIRVAGYDSRLSPDLGGFLERSIALIEETY